MTNIPKWIFASASKHFQDVCTANTIPMFVEGQTTGDRRIDSFVEFRMDGPDVVKGTSSSAKYDFSLNTFIQVAQTNTYYHRIHDLCGIMADAFINMLPISSYGETPVEVIGCASLLKDHKNRDVRVFHLGQVNPTIRILRASVLGRYSLAL